MVHAIFYIHQTSGTFAGMCTCDRTHHMENIVTGVLNTFLFNNIETGQKEIKFDFQEKKIRSNTDIKIPPYLR